MKDVFLFAIFGATAVAAHQRDLCRVLHANGSCIPEFIGGTLVSNLANRQGEPYAKKTYETFLLDSGDGDYGLELDFQEFNTCENHDFLTVYDGPDQGYPVLMHHSGHMNIPNVKSSQRYMFLEFNASRRDYPKKLNESHPDGHYGMRR